MKAAVASMPELQDLIDRLMKFGISKTSMILSTPFADRQPAGLRGRTAMADVRREPYAGVIRQASGSVLHRRHEPEP